MAVDEDFHVVVAGPADGLFEECVGAGLVWCSAVVIGPVSDWNAKSIEACRGETGNVGFCEEGRPVFLKSFLSAWKGIKCVLVFGGGEGAREQVFCHPFLENEPAAEVDTLQERKWSR